MASHNSDADVTAKVPQRRRGLERVAELLEAASVVFARAGYEAATMTEIAAEACAAIGSLYQFFPTKTLLADALYLRDMDALAAELQNATDAVTPCPLHVIADRLFITLIAFVDSHPALPIVSDRRRADATPPVPGRPTMREQMAELMRRADPKPTPKQARRAATMVHVMMKGTVAAQVKDGPEGKQVIEDVRSMLRARLVQPL